MSDSQAPDRSDIMIPIVYAIPTTWPMSFSLPKNIWPGWEFVQPTVILIERDEEGDYIVSDQQTTIYGVGNAPDEAIKDYLLALMEYYQLFEQDAAGRDQEAQKHLDRLRQYFHPIAENA